MERREQSCQSPRSGDDSINEQQRRTEAKPQQQTSNQGFSGIVSARYDSTIAPKIRRPRRDHLVRADAVAVRRVHGAARQDDGRHGAVSS